MNKSSSENRKRKAPFTSFEKAFLRELVAELIHVVESKKTDSEESRKKVRAWENISIKYNANPQCQPASADQLKKLWLNMKSKARDAKTAVKQRCHTGGGPYIPDPNPDDDAVLEMIPNILPTIKVGLDSDGYGDQDGDNDDDSWLSKKKRKESIKDIVFIDEEEYKITPCTIATTNTITSATTTTDSVIQGEYIITPCTIATTNTITSATNTTDSVIPSISFTQTTKTPSASQNDPKKKKSTFSKQPPNVSIDELKCELITRDIEQRQAKHELELSHQQKKYQLELSHQQKKSELEYNMMLLEYEHKKRLFNLIEKEQQLLVNKAQENNN